jgi:hypothetical protein
MKKFEKIIIFGSLVLGCCVITVLLYSLNILGKPQETYKFKEIRTFIKKDEKNLEYVLTKTFDKARSCNELTASSAAQFKCRQETSSEIYSKLPHIKDLIHDESTYFIRLNNQQEIEKMFLDGKFGKINPNEVPSHKWCPTNTHLCDNQDKNHMIRQQQKVKALLEGKYIRLPENFTTRDHTLYNQSFDPKFFYLLDLSSEFEFIHLVTIDNKNVGAIVRLHGD